MKNENTYTLEIKKEELTGYVSFGFSLKLSWRITGALVRLK